MNNSISTVGGADGPTTILFGGSIGTSWLHILGVICVVILGIGCIYVIRKNRTVKLKSKLFGVDKPKDTAKNKGKSPGEMISDGVLDYGVSVGRFVFEEEGYTVFTISDLTHAGASDVYMVYQISKEDYLKLLSMSCKNNIPDPPVPSETTSPCRKKFLCGESAYCERYFCSLADVNLSWAEKSIGIEKQE